MNSTYDLAVQAFVEMIENHGYTLSMVEDFTPEDFINNFGLEISQENLNAALNDAIEKCSNCCSDEFWND